MKEGHFAKSGRVDQEEVVRPVFWMGLLLCMSARALGADAKNPPAPKDKSDADLLAVQGKWEREEPSGSTNPYRRAVKEVKGQEEVVTYYKADGSVWRAHRAQFDLSRSGDVRVFTFSNVQIIEGDGKGTRLPQGRSYIYVATDREFREVSGFLPGQEAQHPSVLVWSRAKTDDRVAALPAPDPGLQGAWVPYHSEEGGVDQKDQRNYLVKFDGDRFEVVRSGELMLRGKFITYTAREPRRIDIKMEQDADNPVNAGKTLRGIYVIDGDQLRWCTGTTAAPQPPTEFTTREGEPFLLVAMRRQKAGNG
jgi:uncharacterized protein (TIGR03067 family)